MAAGEHHHSDLVELAKRNGDFRRNYGLILGAFLYLRSIEATRGRSFTWFGIILAAIGAFSPWASGLVRSVSWPWTK